LRNCLVEEKLAGPYNFQDMNRNAIRLSLLLLLGFSSMIFSASFEIYAISNLSNLNYEISDTQIKGNMPNRMGFGVSIQQPVFDPVSIELAYQKYPAAKPDNFAESMEISAVLLNVAYRFSLGRQSSVNFKAGLSYSNWILSNLFSLSDLRGELGYQCSAELMISNFFIEGEYFQFNACEPNYIEVTKMVNGHLVSDGFRDMIVHNVGCSIKAGVHFFF